MPEGWERSGSDRRWSGNAPSAQHREGEARSRTPTRYSASLNYCAGWESCIHHDNEFLVHPIRIVILQVAHRLVPARRQRPGGPPDRTGGDPVTVTGRATVGHLAEAAGLDDDLAVRARNPPTGRGTIVDRALVKSSPLTMVSRAASATA